MSNPDFTDYIDFTIYDLDASTIYTDAVEYAKTSFPEFTPRVGTIENALLEASSFQTMYMVDAVNRLPDGLMEGLLKLMGFNRVSATASEATVEFEVTVNTGVTISAGTVVSYDVTVDGVLTQYLYETETDLVIASGNTTGTTSVVAVNPSEYPEIPVGSTLTLVSTSPYILDVTLTALASVGKDAETDTEYFRRGATFLASLNNSLVTSSQMTNYIAVTYPTVARFKVYDLTDSADMDFSEPAVAGEVTIALCDSVGDPIGSAQKTIIQDDLESRTVAGLNINLYDMQIFDVDIAVSVVVETNYSTATVSTAVSAAIEQYLSIAGWDWKQDIDSRRLVAIAAKVPGVSYVVSAACTLPTAVPTLATASSGNITILEKGAIPIGACTTTAT